MNGVNKSAFWSLISLFVKNPGALSAGLVRFGQLALLTVIAQLASDAMLAESLTPIGLSLATAGLAAVAKWFKNRFGVGL